MPKMFECAVTGTVHEADGEDAREPNSWPATWTKVTIERRVLNPRWVELTQAKNAIVMSIVQNVPEQLRDLQGYLTQAQFDAIFHAILAQTPMYINDVQDTVFVSSDDEALEVLNDMRKELGLEKLPDLQNFEADDEDDSDETDVSEEIDINEN